VTVACYLEPTKPKADKWMRAFARGCGGRVVLSGERDPVADDHVVMGNWPTASKLIAKFAVDRTPFWYLDAAYIQGSGRRYLRVERNRFWPDLQQGGYTPDRALSMGVRIQPWSYDGSYVLVCLHGMKFGRPWGIDIETWNETIEERIRTVTDRPIVVRPKPFSPKARREAPPIEEQFADAWCVVTHSSTIAVQAVLAGVPVFCEPTCAAAPVGRTDLEIESPSRPDREEWVAALAWRQWSRSEMQSGEAWAYVRAHG
jgi:hypothetical protein